jgi:outer membrane lipoprotein-sorting protein
MNRISLFTVIVALSLGVGPAIAADNEKDVEFEGYSSRAETAVERMLRALDKLKSYSDEAVIKFETGMSFAQQEQDVAFTYVKPKRFHIKAQNNELVSDGKQLTVFMKNMQRYKTTPLKEDIGTQISSYVGAMGMSFGAAELMLAKNAKEVFAKQFKELDLTGKEEIDGDRCLVLEGAWTSTIQWFPDEQPPVSVYLRESDFMIRRIEIDLLEIMKKQFEENNTPLMVDRYEIIYDVRGLQINEPVDPGVFTFEPPSAAKKVEQFYGSWAHIGDTAMQFELSGKRAPDFELESTDGTPFVLSSFEGKVCVLYFMGGWWGGTDPTTTLLGDIQKEYLEKDVVLACIFPHASANKVVEYVEENDIALTVLPDAGREVGGEYFDEQNGTGVVLVGRDGKVQGLYRSLFRKESDTHLRNDIDKLLNGETLPGGKPMSEEQITEAQDQRAGARSIGSAEALNQDRLKETWSIRARGGNSWWGQSTGSQSDDAGFWVRDKAYVRHVDADGQVDAEVVIANPSKEMYVQDAFTVGRIGAHLAVVYMAPILDDEQQGGWRPPKGAVLSASDESGDELWQFEIEVENNQLPNHLQMADLDGRAGDELIFLQGGAIWIIDDRGEVIVRFPCQGQPQWIRAEDRDRDRRAEVYLRTSHKLHRFDYQPR